MTSYRIGVKPHRRAAARLVAEIHRTFQQAYTEEHAKGLTQSKIAQTLGVNRSVINRQLRGTADMSAGRMAELAWALGRKAKFTLETVDLPAGSNATKPVGIIHLGTPQKTSSTNATTIMQSPVIVKENEPA